MPRMKPPVVYIAGDELTQWDGHTILKYSDIRNSQTVLTRIQLTLDIEKMA
jgi:hypothetical protein